jgi:hypothetical protein
VSTRRRKRGLRELEKQFDVATALLNKTWMQIEELKAKKARLREMQEQLAQAKKIRRKKLC